MRRLGVERIDLYQMHWPAGDGTSLDGYWETLLALKREGKVGAVGLSNHNLAQLQDAEALGHVDSLQPPFSAIQQRGRRSDSLVRGARHRRHRLQPDAVGPVERRIQRGARGQFARR